MGYFLTKKHEKRYREHMEKVGSDPKLDKTANVIAGLVILALLYGVWSVFIAIFGPDTPAEIAVKQAKIEQTAREESQQKVERSMLFAISEAEVAIKQSLRDPQSLTFEQKAWNLDNSSMCFVYRARNGFGGMNRATMVVVDGKASESNAMYKKYCPKNANYTNYTF